MEPEVFEIHKPSFSKVEFDNITPTYQFHEKKLSWMMQQVINLSQGKIRTKTGASYVLLGIASVCFVLSIFFIIRAFGSPSQPDPKNIIQVAGPDQIRQK